MVSITKYLAAQMESCIKKTHINVTKLYSFGEILEINDGAACFSGYNSYLSQVVGWGFATGVNQFSNEIERIEHFYRSLNHQRVDIELCPYVGNDLALFLSRRGYYITELNNVSLLNLKNYEPKDYLADPFTIKEIDCTEEKEWAKKIALGFEAPEAKNQFLQYVRSQGVHVFAVYDNLKIVAGATLAVHDQFCDLGVASTLPAYRSKGLQKKLLQTRLNVAQQMGLSWAMVTTEPGTISDSNVQKVGFCCAYTRIKMTKDFFKVRIGRNDYSN